MEKIFVNSPRFFIFSIILITLAHFVRILRWSLFISVYEQPKTQNLIRSLSLGYFVSLLLPFKLGDLIRAWLSGKKMKNGGALGFSTVIIDRYLDILVVGIIFCVFLASGKGNDIVRASLVFYIGLSSCILAVSILCLLFKKYVKRGTKLFASIFAPSIELKILKFSWALILNFKDIATKINKIKLLLSTVLMWALYVCSYYFFAEFISSHDTVYSWMDMFISLFARDSIQTSGYSLTSLFNNTSFFYVAYMVIQFAILLAISFIHFQNVKNSNAQNHSQLNLLPHTNNEERLRFLELYFSDKNRQFIKNYLRINQNILIIRDFSAGSNATTMLCMNEKGNFFRKYAFGSDGDKLYEQVLWLKKFSNVLPLPKIIQEEKDQDFCYYDMEAPSNAVGLFEYSHSSPFESSWKLLKSTLEVLEKNLYIQNRRGADLETIEKYIESKVEKNIVKILNGKYIKPLLKYDEILINGKSYRNLKSYFPMLSKENLLAVFRNDEYSEIHGDLTIENIICTRGKDGSDGFYIIDPNTGNLHDSPNLDYGKMLQSIGGGYEFLMKTQNVEVDGNRVNFIFTKSEVYTKLHARLDEYMDSHFTPERVRSIYYHSVIHWLRLMPYKIDRNGIRSVLFYAGLLMVLDDVEKRFREGVHLNGKE